MHISAGTTIELINRSSIVSNGPVFIKGSKDNPVIINGSKGGQGLAILNAKEKSLIQHTTFLGLKGRNKNGQILDGGVTFYQSDFACTRCVFENSQSKDALTIIGSKYKLEDVVILNANGDGVDANQSTGEINNFIAEKIGKDAVEITGGYLHATGINVNKVFGAALNLTRNGIAELTNNFIIKNSEKGIMASDLGKVKVDFLTLEKVAQGVIVYEKLPEYGPAEVNIRDFNAKEIGQLHVLESGANLTIKNNRIDVK